MGTETLAGLHHRCGVLWVITGLGCGRSRVQIPGGGEGTPIFEGVSFKGLMRNIMGYQLIPKSHKVGEKVGKKIGIDSFKPESEKLTILQATCFIHVK